MTDQASDEVMVTQADREAAAAYMKLIADQRWSQHGILSGGCDSCSVTVAFAAHAARAIAEDRRGRTFSPTELDHARIEGVKAGLEAAAREAGRNHHGVFAAVAIRAIDPATCGERVG